MPAMMGNQPMKDSYVGGLEKSVARKVGDVMGANRKAAKMLVRGASNIVDDASKMFVKKPAKMIAKMFDGGKPSAPKPRPERMKDPLPIRRRGNYPMDAQMRKKPGNRFGF